MLVPTSTSRTPIPPHKHHHAAITRIRDPLSLCTIPLQPINDTPLELLFFAQSTSPGQKEQALVWRQVLGSISSSHAYSQLCLSSIERLYFFKDIQSDAYCDQIAASRIFRGSHFTVDETNWADVLVFTISMVIFQFASQQAQSEQYDIMETFYVLRASAGVAKCVGPFLLRSGLGESLKLGNLGDSYGEDIAQALEKLLNCALEMHGEKREVMCQAVGTLMGWARSCNGRPKSWNDYVIFPGAVSAEYLQLLADGDNHALLIFVHWCAIIRLGLRRWFFETWLGRSAAMAVGGLKGD